MAKKAGKKDKHGHNFIIFSQATGQTWYHISAHHLSALGKIKAEKSLRIWQMQYLKVSRQLKLWRLRFCFIEFECQ